MISSKNGGSGTSHDPTIIFSGKKSVDLNPMKLSHKNVDVEIIWQPKERRKKNSFFLLLVKKLRPPPPPPFLTTSVFSDKDFFDSAQIPPPFSAKNGQKTTSFFYIKPPFFWQIMPKNLSFSDKTFMDWVRPPPLGQKIWIFSDKDFLDWPRPPRPPFD